MAEIPRLTKHFEPEAGWINDPNGLCFFKGQYHAFFQHYPHAPKWGPMHWGHAVSDDLIHWKELPIALYPDMPYENGGGCFSGSALERDGTLYLMYTSVSKEQGQTQSMAVSEDGLRFVKLPENPVIAHSPLDLNNRDFRDPKIFPYGKEYRMVCGSGVDGLASVLLFRSDDLLHWQYMNPIFQSREYGPVPECPDLFPLGDKWVLLFSRMDETRSVQFVVGDFDGERFTPESFQQPEVGTDFYAAQSFLDNKNRRLVIGWLFNWNRAVPENAVRAGALSLARELSLQNGRLFMAPVAEAKPFLTAQDGCVERRAGKVTVTNGRRVLLERPEQEVFSLEIYADTRTREVFLNHGELCCSFYLE